MTRSPRHRTTPSAGAPKTRNRDVHGDGSERVDSRVSSLPVDDPDFVVAEEVPEGWHWNGRNSNQLPVAQTTEPSPDVVLPLLRHQKEWLSWALSQEASQTRGGILADEMGMGKTIGAIALVLTARSRRRKSRAPSVDDFGSCSSSSVLPRTGCTLVICPVLAVDQWKVEIKKCTEKGSTRVLVHHGQTRARTKDDFDNHDIIITTYATLQHEFCKHRGKRCDYCSKGLREHQDKDYRSPAKNQAKQGLSDNENVEGKGEKGVGESLKERSILHTVRWERIILDEAHSIKEIKSQRAQAVFALESLYKWALSATPFQNGVKDIFSLVRFLQIHPFSYHLCNQCDCKVHELCAFGGCSACPHSLSQHIEWWYENITLPMSKSDSHGREQTMTLLKESVLKHIMLRRTKEGSAADLVLPQKLVYVRRDSLDKNENSIYRSLHDKTPVKFDKYAEAGTILEDCGNTFERFYRMRKVLDHPYLLLPSESIRVPNVSEDGGIRRELPEATRNTCLTGSNPLTVDLKTNNSGKKKSELVVKLLDRFGKEGIQTSTKIDALKEEVRNMLEDDASAKGVVFSQFVPFLGLIQHFLEDCGVKCVKLDGDTTLDVKKKAINSFTEDGDCKIMLMSLKSGECLNLTVASHVFMMDPWWNPAVERQAQDRIHRPGQFKPIRIVRFIIRDTIEERILKLQEKRELAFQGTLGDSTEDMIKNLEEEDFKFLFQ